MRKRRGSALVEFAGSLMLLGGTFVGVFQIGYTFFTYNTLVNAVRAGARYASLQPAGSSAADPEFSKSVQNLVVYGDPKPAAQAKPIVPGLALQNVELVLGDATATVSLRGFQIDTLFSKINLDGRPTVTFPLTAGAGQ